MGKLGSGGRNVNVEIPASREPLRTGAYGMWPESEWGVRGRARIIPCDSSRAGWATYVLVSPGLRGWRVPRRRRVRLSLRHRQEFDVRANGSAHRRSRPPWRLALSIALTFAFALGVSSASEVYPLEELEPGQRAQALTVLQGDETETIEVEILGVLDDWIGPGVPLVLGRFVDELGRFKGVASGMSGSPVFIDGKLLGALSYSIGMFTKEPICGITPIDTMLALEKHPAGALSWLPEGAAKSEIEPVPLALSVRGMGAHQIDALSETWAELGLAPRSGAPAARAPQELTAESLQPGHPVTVLLTWGDLEIGATGTVTYRDGDRLLAFGHPFLGLGRVAMPLAPARTVWTIPSLANSFKISTFGEPVGSLTQDRLTAIEGRIGPVPEGIPIAVKVHWPDAPELVRDYRCVRHPLYTPVLAGALLRSTLLNTVSSEGDHALSMTGSLHLADGRAIPLSSAAASGRGGPAALLARDLQIMLARLTQAPLELPEIERVELDVVAVPRAGAYTVVGALPEKLVLRAGESLAVKVALRGERGQRIERSLSLDVPEDALPGRYTLLVGSSRTLRSELGSVHEAKRRSARDADAYLASLSEVASGTRLEARLVLQAEGLVAEGREYPALPGSAHILLRSRPGGGQLYRTRWLSVATTGAELGRQLEGKARTTITVQATETP